MQEYAQHGIVPDLLKSPPPKVLKVEYKSSKKEADLGNELTPKDVREAPSVSYEADPKSFYTLIMSDPDAPSRKEPTRKEWNHWLVGNIPGSDVQKGDVISEYVGAGPPKDTGLHRYVFFLYKQPGKIKFDEPKKSKTDGKRANFSSEAFAKKYKLGSPVAGNFFQAKYDDTVPALHKQLGF